MLQSIRSVLLGMVPVKFVSVAFINFIETFLARLSIGKQMLKTDAQNYLGPDNYLGQEKRRENTAGGKSRK